VAGTPGWHPGLFILDHAVVQERNRWARETESRSRRLWYEEERRTRPRRPCHEETQAGGVGYGARRRSKGDRHSAAFSGCVRASPLYAQDDEGDRCQVSGVRFQGREKSCERE